MFSNDQQTPVFAPDLFRMLFRNPSLRSQVGSEDEPPPVHPSTFLFFFSPIHFALFTSYVIISFREAGAWSRVRAGGEGSFSVSLPPSTPQPLQSAGGNYRGSGKLEQRASRQRGRAGRDPGWPHRYKNEGGGLLSEWGIAYIEFDWAVSEIGKDKSAVRVGNILIYWSDPSWKCLVIVFKDKMTYVRTYELSQSAPVVQTFHLTSSFHWPFK